MGKHIVIPKEFKTRTYKLLLYPDNKQHIQVLKRIQRDTTYNQFYVGIWHIEHDEKNNVVMQGHGKKHCHLLLDLPNAVYWQALCKKLGFEDEEGNIDCRFCMPVSVSIEQKTGQFVKDRRGSLERGYIYLIHLNTPDKEQYNISDLWGAPEKLQNAYTAIQGYLSKNISMSACVYMALDWINKQSGLISYKDFTEWLCNSPYFKCQSSPLVRAVLDEHNRKYFRRVQLESKTQRQNITVSGSDCSTFDLFDSFSYDDDFDGGFPI